MTSAKTRRFSAHRQMMPLLMTTSAEQSSSGKSSITPCAYSTLRRPIAAAAARDRPSISSVMSTRLASSAFWAARPDGRPGGPLSTAVSFRGGTEGSNPPSSSRQSASRGISPSCIEKPAVAAACAGPARRHGRQRRAGLVNITPTAGNVSVGPYFSTAAPARRFASVVALVPSEVGLAMRPSAEFDPAQAKPSTVRCSCQPSGRRECSSCLSALRSGG